MSPTNSTLKVVCGRNQAKLEAGAEQWGWQETATDWQAVVDRPDIDVVDIAVPNVLHAPIAIAAAQAGKIVFCEKPLATSLAEAETMAQAMRKVPTLVWFNYRRIPAVAFAKRLIAEGRIGQTYHYRALYLNQSGSDPSKATTWRYRKSEAGMGAAGDLLSHSIDSALYLNGPITELTALMHNFAAGRDVDDATLLLAQFANGSIGTFEATRYGVGCRNRKTFEINGSKGMLRFDLEELNQLEFLDATDPPNLQGSAQSDRHRPRPSILGEFLEARLTSSATSTPSSPPWETFWAPWPVKNRCMLIWSPPLKCKEFWMRSNARQNRAPG